MQIQTSCVCWYVSGMSLIFMTGHDWSKLDEQEKNHLITCDHLLSGGRQGGWEKAFVSAASQHDYESIREQRGPARAIHVACLCLLLLVPWEDKCNSISEVLGRSFIDGEIDSVWLSLCFDSCGIVHCGGVHCVPFPFFHSFFSPSRSLSLSQLLTSSVDEQFLCVLSSLAIPQPF